MLGCCAQGSGIDFSDGRVVKNLPADTGDMDLIPGLEDSTCLRATEPMFHNY